MHPDDDDDDDHDDHDDDGDDHAICDAMEAENGDAKPKKPNGAFQEGSTDATPSILLSKKAKSLHASPGMELHTDSQLMRVCDIVENQEPSLPDPSSAKLDLENTPASAKLDTAESVDPLTTASTKTIAKRPAATSALKTSFAKKPKFTKADKEEGRLHERLRKAAPFGRCPNLYSA